MDYPKTVPGVGLVAGKFSAGNPGQGVPASLDPAEWANAVTDELLGVITSLGLVPNEADVGQVARAIGMLSELPLSALAFPTIATADNRLAVTAAAVAGQGGTVGIPAGVLISLAQEVVPGVTGRMRAWTTALWTSANLLANTTYFLRAQVVGGVLQPYMQQGTDADAIPPSQKGVPNAVSGGGFDSTQIDILLAKVVTGAAGSVPTVTPLANRALLRFSAAASSTTVVTSTSGGGGYSPIFTLNWARAPTVIASFGWDFVPLTGTGAPDRMYIDTQSANRYRATVSVTFDMTHDIAGNVSMYVNAQGVA